MRFVKAFSGKTSSSSKQDAKPPQPPQPSVRASPKGSPARNSQVLEFLEGGASAPSASSKAAAGSSPRGASGKKTPQQSQTPQAQRLARQVTDSPKSTTSSKKSGGRKTPHLAPVKVAGASTRPSKSSNSSHHHHHPPATTTTSKHAAAAATPQRNRLPGKNDDMDFGSLRLADEDVGSLSSSDEDEDSDVRSERMELDDRFPADGESGDVVGRRRPKKSTMKTSVSERGTSFEDNDSDDDVVRQDQRLRNPRGLLDVRRNRVGAENNNSESDNESDSSDSLNEHEPVEDLFEETLTQLRDQEARDRMIMTAEAPVKVFPIDVLKEVPFFAQFSNEHQMQLFAELEEEQFQDGDLIVRQGDLGDKFYVIIEGEAVVSKTLETGETIDLTHIYQADFFGELVLIYGGERVATVTSYGRTTCMSLSRKSFEKYDDIRYFLILQKVPLLAGVPRDVQLEIVKKLKPAKYNKDEFVVKQGERGDAFFMITKGSAVVIEDDDKIITRLYEGHSFGEMALLSDEPRVASVKAATELNVMYLTVDDFKVLLSADDFSKLLEQENKKIRELRDRRQWKRVNSVSAQQRPGGLTLGAGSGPVVPQQLNAGGNRTGAATTASSSTTTSASASVSSAAALAATPLGVAEANKRMRGTSQTQRPAGVQQKLKTGKTSGGAKIVNNYVLLEQIGKGTFGVVRLCERVDTKERFAIKIIDKSLFKNKIKSRHQTSLEDMRREAAIMKRLSHENVVNLVDVIDDPKAEQLYLVQEYCELGAIMDKLEGNNPLAEPTARKYFRDLLSGIDYLHRHGIVHRDIKPMNLLLTADHVVKIGDFGAARVLQGNQAIGIAGTPAFMAPELLSQDQNLYNGPAVDLWSCGATLFMLVTGVPPWMADDEPTLAKKVLNDELVFPGQWGKKLSPHLRNLITRLLVKDPAQRLTLTGTMEHEWVTEEGADPLPRFVEVQPQLIRVNSSLFPALDDTMRNAITMIETSGSETPQTPSTRKQLGGAGATAAASPRTPSDNNMVATPSPRSGRNPHLPPASSASSRDGGSKGHQQLQQQQQRLELGNSVLSVEDDDDDDDNSDREADSSSQRRKHADSVDYAMYDVGKKRDAESAPREKSSGHGRQPSGSFYQRQKKKMSLIPFSRKNIKDRRSRAGSATSKEDVTGTTPTATTASDMVIDEESTHGSIRKESSNSALSPKTSEIRDEREEEEEMSLSAVLNDKSMFKAAQHAKVQKMDMALNPLSPWVPLVKAKRGHAATHCSVKYGYGEDQGGRANMEDFVAIVPKLRNPDTFFAAVFDGHGGDMVSKELKSRLHRVLSAQPEFSSAALSLAAMPSSPQISNNKSTLGVRLPPSSSSSATTPTGAAPGANSSSSSIVSQSQHQQHPHHHHPHPQQQPGALGGGGGGGGGGGMVAVSSAVSMTMSATSSSASMVVDGHAPATAPSSPGATIMESQFYDSTGLPIAIRRACLLLDRAMLHYAATELLDMESRVARGDQQKGLFRTKGGGTKIDSAGDAYRKAGSTAVFALIRGVGGARSKNPCVLTVGWVGDSRAVLSRAGRAIELSRDHKAERDDEKVRIRANGGAVDRHGRLYGDLAVSRAFGDLQHKGRELSAIVARGPTPKGPGDEDWGSEGTLIALPDTCQTVITKEDEFVILASDGVWDVMSSEQAVNFVRFHLQRHGDCRKAAVELVDKALDLRSVDNVSAVVIGFCAKY